MEIIRVAGHIDENGHIEIDQPNRLPPGDVMITIERISSEDETAQAAFDELLASPKSLAFLKQRGEQVLAEDEADLTDELDPEWQTDAINGAPTPDRHGA